MLKRILIFVCTLGLGTLALATPAGAADGFRAFRGEVTGQVHFAPTGDPSCTEIPVHTVSEGVGQATHLGPVTMDSTHCSGNTIAGEMTFAGKHGSVVVSYAGACTPVPPFPSEITCNLTFDVIGGSGRFEGADGSGTMTAKVHPDLSLPNPLEGVWPARWAFEGRIAY